MARPRQIKPHFLHSASMSKVSVGAQLTFIRLWLIADDAGRPEEYGIELNLYPGRPEIRRQVAGWLEELERVGGIVRYRFKGRAYLRVVNWRKHQKIQHPTPSKLPVDEEGARESFASVSGKAREQIASNPPKGPQPQERTAVLAKSRATREQFQTNPPKAAKPRRFGPLRERLARNFLFLCAAG